MKRLLGFGVLACALACAGENLSFIGDTDKNPLSYRLNETITFTVKLVDKDAGNAAVAGRELRWTLSHDDKTLDRSGTATSDTPLVVTTAMSQPGFARLVVEVQDGGTWLSGTTQVFDGGAGADVLNIQEWPEPADFRNFWTTATNQLYTTAYAPVCTNFVPAGAAAGVKYYLFELPTLPGLLPATGILAKPAAADPASCGVVATFNGYGFGATALPSASTVLQGNIVINVARHGEYPVHPDAGYYTDLQNGPMKSFCFRNLDGTVQQTDQYGMLMRDLRALQFAKSLPEWNHETVEVSGGSMGGYQALAMAGLDGDVTKCTVNIPWHVDLSSGVKFGRMTGWRPGWTANMDYVDAKNFAKLIRCPVTFTAGLGDYVCPPSGEVLLWKNLPEPKKVTWTQNSSHPGNRGPVCAQYVWQAPEPEPEPLPGRTLNWVGGGADRLFSNALNWKDAAGGTNAVPQDDDVLSIAVNTGDAKNDIPNLHPYQIKVSGYQTQSASGEPLIFRSGSGGIYNTGYLHFDLPIALVGTNVPYFSNSTCVQRGKMYGVDGRDCGIVKIGSSRAGLQPGAGVTSAAAFAGFRFVTIREGQWIYGINGGASKMNLLPKGQTVTFDGQGTSLGISQDCVFEDFCLRETANARNKAHAITCQKDGDKPDPFRAKLTVTGVPPDDETVFTGTFESAVDFCWNPASSLKTFTLSGKTSTTVGDVEVANGTLRLTNGAGYSQLGELKLSGGAGAKLVVDTAPYTPFHAQTLVLVNGTERLQLAAGVTLTVAGATVAGVRIPGRTYTKDNANWIAGDGVVVVEGVTSCTLTWAKKATYANLNWNNPDNWVNGYTGLPDVPVDGDIIKLPGRGAYDAGGAAGRTDNTRNNLVNFRPRRIYVQSGYSSPAGNPVIFDGTDPTDGIYNDGYMYYIVPTIVNTDAITIHTSSSSVNYGHRADIYSTDGHAFTVRKTGAGLLGLACETSGRNKYAGFRHLELHGGKFSFSWQKFGVGDSFPRDFDICYMAKDTYLQCSVDTTLQGAVIREASAAANQTHYLGAQNGEVVTLTIAGEPEADSLFTGVLQNPLSFTWAPENGRTFTFSGASSKNLTAGTLTVRNGAVVLKDGATFTQLDTLALDGEGTTFRVESAPATAFHANALTVASGAERLYVEGGVKLAVDTLKVGGQSLPAGVYHSADNAGGTGVAWIMGGGYLCVGGADVVLPTESAATTTGLWTAGGGSDTAVGTAANWDGQVLPDLASGSLNATFAAGSAATLDRDAHVKGIAFSAPGAGFALTRAAGSSWVNYLGSLGLSTAGGTGKTYTLAAPTYLVAPQTWTVGSKDVLDVNGPLVGQSTLTVANAGTVNVNAGGVFSGPVSVSGGTVNVNADGAFGESLANPVEVDFSKTKFNLNGVTLKRGIKSLGGAIAFPANTENVIEGIVDFTQNDGGTIAFGANAVVRAKKGWARGTTAWHYFKGSDSAHPGTLVLDGPFSYVGGAANGLSGNMNLYVNAPDCDLGVVWFWLTGSNNHVYLTVPYAFRWDVKGHDNLVRATDVGANNVIDLCGNDQSLLSFGANANVTVTSSKPATLDIHTEKWNQHTHYGITNRACWADAANLAFTGAKYLYLAGTSTSTGTVTVTRGALKFMPTGAWPNASAVIARGGTLTCENKTAFGRETTLKVTTGATVELAYAGAMKLKAVEIDGEALKAGVYGGPSSTASSKLACFAGAGVISVGSASTVLLLR